MFSTTHDIILLAIGALYLVVLLIRLSSYNAFIRANGQAPGAHWWLTVPLLISAATIITAALW